MAHETECRMSGKMELKHFISVDFPAPDGADITNKVGLIIIFGLINNIVYNRPRDYGQTDV